MNKKTETGSREYYEDLHGKGWTDEFSFRGPTMRIRNHMIFRELQNIQNIENKSILDIGCADFGLLLEIKKRWRARKLYGADITSASFGEIPERENIRSRAFDISAQTWEGLEFDIIIAADMLEHVKDDTAALANIRKMLAPGGVFVFHLPFSMKYWSAHDQSVGHFRRYQAAEFAQKLDAAGLAGHSIKTYGFPFLTSYFKLVLARVPPERTQRTKSPLERLATILLYTLFRFDTLFPDHKCRRGFALAGSATSK